MAKKYFKIIPIKHLLKNNKTAKAGEIVEGGAFVNLQDSLDRGFCVEEKKKKPKGVDKAAEEKAAKDAKAAEEKAAKDAKAAEENEEVDLSTLDEEGIIAFAKENDFKLTKKVIKEGKDAMIASIIKQAE